MRVRLQDLDKVVKRIIAEVRVTESLRDEVVRVLGNAVLAEGSAHEVAREANDRLDVLDRTGRAGRAVFKTSLMIKLLEHPDAEIRKLAARTAPVKFLGKVTFDREPSVRSAVARRLPLKEVARMVTKFSSDDELLTIYKEKSNSLREAGLKDPKVVPMGIDPVAGKERMGDVSRLNIDLDLSDTWYDSVAERLINDYGRVIEDSWEELAVKRLCRSMKATSGVEVDEGKLLKAVVDRLKERDDIALERDALEESYDFGIDESTDAVSSLLKKVGSSEFLWETHELYTISDCPLSNDIQRHLVTEGVSSKVLVPFMGILPHRGSLQPNDEKVLNAYCKAWNDRQKLRPESVKIEWLPHPRLDNRVMFNVTLR